MKIEEFVVGEIYEWNGRRARVESIGRDAYGLAEVEISYGRSFESRFTLRAAGSFAPDLVRGINTTWTAYKEIKIKQKAQREHAADLSEGFREVLSEIGGMHGWVEPHGRLHITGDLQKLDQLLIRLRDSAGSKSGSALDSLLG